MSKHAIQYDDLLRSYFSFQPEDVDGLNNASTVYYTTWCLRKIFGIYAFENLPAGWDADYMLQRLFIDGHFCITDTDLGVLPLQCGITGVNVFNHPNECLVANAVLGSFRRKIADSVGSTATLPDKVCALVKLQYDYAGIMPTINRYAVMLSMCDSASAVNLLNSKTAFVFAADNQKEARSFQMMFDKISRGEPAVFVGDGLANKLRDKLVLSDVKQMFIADDIAVVKQKIINDFLSDVGIHNANTEKRERLIQNEVDSNHDEVRSGAEHWLETVNDGLRIANTLYGLDIRFTRKSFLDRQQEVTTNEFTKSA